MNLIPFPRVFNNPWVRGFLPAQDRPLHAARTLRMARVQDDSLPKHQAGRMVISGRMADVCAELDRLVALERAH
ncbi:MAG: hypothetical protein FGM28_07770 [Limnohabitans sp.]|jgi:hypothetical protein|nr:hypothetical protein [Limnohabitans sp.]